MIVTLSSTFQDSSCGENVRILGNVTKPPNNLEIRGVQSAGVVQCAVSTNAEILDYFTGADNQICKEHQQIPKLVDLRIKELINNSLDYDWNEALTKQALVRVIPNENYSRYTPHKPFGFTCRYSTYVAVNPVWWALKYKNGTFVESYGETYLSPRPTLSVCGTRRVLFKNAKILNFRDQSDEILLAGPRSDGGQLRSDALEFFCLVQGGSPHICRR